MLILIAVLAVSLNADAQSMTKKYRTFSVSREMPFPADKVWTAVADDYGNIANSHPLVVKSNYVKGSLKGEEGAQRMCYFNDKETKSLYEEITSYDASKMTFTNRVLEAQKFPIDPDNTQAIYKVESLGNGKSLFTMTMSYRTKPAFMGAMAKSKFKKLLNDYMLSVEHNIATGESVTASNFRDVKRQYR